MNVTIAESSGFCYGVRRAVSSVEKLIAEGKKVCTLGPLIHNPQIVKNFEDAGVIVVQTPKEVPEGYTVVIRSHGIPKKVFEEIKELGIPYFDATCLDVLKIHELARDSANKNMFVIVAGDADHPEVAGITSYCDEKWIAVSTADELKVFLESADFSQDMSYALLAQTTFNEKEWVKCKEIVKNTYTNVNIFDTICRATMLRQKAAAELAKKSDCMIVVGGYNSSNTGKLANVCEKHCKTVRIESPEELLNFSFEGMSSIGVTAGASTPAFIIKEVQRNMSDVVNNTEEMSFEEMLNESFKTVSAREKVTAIVTSVAPNEIAVDIGTKHAGYVPLNEYTDDPNADLEELVKPGDEIELMVLRLNDAEGTALLSKKRLDAIEGFEKIVAAEENDEKLSGKVVDIVKGGIIALTNGVRVFIPASQASLQRGQDLEVLRGKEVEYKILETNRNRRRAVGSIRAILQAERQELAEKFWDDVEVGQIRKGVVKSLTSYGAFIDLGGVDGMVHISELSWTRIKHPSDVLNVGDEVEVRIKDIDKEEKKISLSYKDEDNNPWAILERQFGKGDVVKVKVVSMTPFGAFAQVIPGVDGLIHISQISTERIEKPSDVLSIGEEVEVKITDIDFDRKRVSLSIRALSEKEEAKKEDEPKLVAQAAPQEETTVVVEEKQESDEIAKALAEAEAIAEEAAAETEE